MFKVFNYQIIEKTLQDLNDKTERFLKVWIIPTIEKVFTFNYDFQSI